MTEGYLAPGVRPPPRGEDLPSDDGEPLETAKHRDQMTLLIDALRTAWKDRTDFYTGGNMFFYYSELQSKKNDYRGPDFFVVLDTDQRPRKSWVVWEEDGRRPDVIVELTSESTKTIDYVDKKALYARLSIAEYFIFDPEDGKLDGFTLDLATRSYTPIAPDARGWLWSGCLGLFLGVARMRRGYDRHEDLWLRFFDRDGEILPTSSELAIALDGRADEERQRADEERQRADEERQRADEERQRAEAEAQRAEQERERAEAEAERARALAEKLAEYERRFGRLT